MDREGGREQVRGTLGLGEKGGLKTGAHIFFEAPARGAGKDQWRFTACIEVGAKARSSGGVRIRTLPATRVAAVRFNPQLVEPRVVYHALNDWTRWQKRYKRIQSVGSAREVYAGNPWTDAKAWARTEVQFLVR